MIKKVLLLFIFFLLTLMFLKSIVVLWFIYTDNYFYQWNFDNPLFSEKVRILLLYGLLIPIISLTILTILLRKGIFVEPLKLISILITSFIIFRYVDVYIRSLLHFSKSHFINAYLDLTIFGLLTILFLFLLVRNGVISLTLNNSKSKG